MINGKYLRILSETTENMAAGFRRAAANKALNSSPRITVNLPKG